MKIAIRGLLTAVILRSLACTANAATPAPQPQPAPTKTTAQAQQDQRGTKQSPLIVELAKTERSAEERANEADKKRHDADELRWTKAAVISSAVLAAISILVNGFLWWTTRKSAKAAEVAAKSSSDTVDALRATERAYLFVEFPIRVGLIGSHAGNQHTDFDLRFLNHGKTPAEIVQIRGYVLVQKETPESLLEFTGSERELPQGMAIAPRDSHRETFRHALTHAEIGELERWEKKLFLVGRVSYRDMFGQLRETGFCWYLLIHGGQRKFIPADSPLNRRT